MSLEQSNPNGDATAQASKASSNYEIESMRINLDSNFTSQLQSSNLNKINAQNPKENLLGSNNQMNFENYGSLEESKHFSLDEDDLESVDLEMQNERIKKNEDKIRQRKKSNLLGSDSIF